MWQSQRYQNIMIQLRLCFSVWNWYKASALPCMLQAMQLFSDLVPLLGLWLYISYGHMTIGHFSACAPAGHESTTVHASPPKQVKFNSNMRQKANYQCCTHCGNQRNIHAYIIIILGGMHSHHSYTLARL